MWSRKGFVQIEVHEIHTKIAGTHLAYQGIHIGTIHVKQAALLMHDVRNLVNLLLEHSQGVGIGKHQRSDLFVHLRRQ